MLNLESGKRNDNGVLEFPIGIVKKGGKISPLLEKDGHILTDALIIRQQIRGNMTDVLRNVDSDALYLIDIGFGSVREDINRRAQEVLDNLYKQTIN